MKEGTFLVTTAEDGAATLRDVADGQLLTLSENPGLTAGEVVEATVRPEPPLEVAYEVVELDTRRTIPVERAAESPTALAHDLAADQPVGELTRRERAGDGEVHVLTVEAGGADAAAGAVLDDEATVERAARLSVDRVEVRIAERTRDDDDRGVVSVRYLPD